MSKLLSIVALLVLVTPWVARAEPLKGDPVAGKVRYQYCQSCHTLDEDDVGPRHRGVVGRRAASVPGYAYSPGLKASGLVWDAATLDRWMMSPQKLVPGTKMFAQVADPQARADIIAYLANPD
jgi:cytochrome c